MNKYLVIARKYRPQKFQDVVGQEAVVQTLKNALQLHKDVHAYLFSGPLGTGKTTIARIFAKALNCPNLSSEQEPCNNCRSCNEITASSSLDVIEIDGASNRGIDDIRQINETIGYTPSSGKFKIIIIDEVHMLTKEAFNALLKTLEEPPETIKFFFATTEPHKIPPTITSRTQRFELKPIALEKIVNNLAAITQDLQREITDDALYLIAKMAGGSLRDAQSLLDQFLCYTEEKITAEIITNHLGLISHDLFFSLDQAFHNQDHAFAFQFVERIIAAGKDLIFFIEKLLEHYRNILFILLQGIDHPQLEIPPNCTKNYAAAATYYTQEQCLHIIHLLMEALIHIPKSLNKQIDIEMLLIQILKTKNILSPSTLVKRLIELEKKIDETPPKEPVVSEEKTEEPVLQEVPFSFPQKSTSSPSLPVKDSSTETSQHKSHYDNLLNFSAVELEGIVTKEE